MSNETENKILLLLGELKGDVQGVHREVRRINGSIKDLYKRTDSLNATRNRQKGAAKVIGLIFGGIVTIVTTAFVFVFK